MVAGDGSANGGNEIGSAGVERDGGKEVQPVEIHIDVSVNPFIAEEDRQAIIDGKAQDPEWD